jgi:hypothetical protein
MMEFLALDRLTRIRLGVALIGVVVWFGGVRIDDSRTRVVGMVVLAVAVLLRFLPKRFHGEPLESQHRTETE